MNSLIKNGSDILNNLYVVESPLQALCALEVSLGKAGENHSIIVRLADAKRSKSNQQLLDIVKLREWDHKIITYPPSKNKIVSHLLKLKGFSDIKKLFKSQVDSLYMGEFRFEYMHIIRGIVDASDVYLLDDGAATVNVIKNYLKKGKYHPDLDSSVPNGLVKKVLHKSLYGRYLNQKTLNKKIHVITSFSKQDSKHAIEELNFDNVKNLYNIKRAINENIVYLYGSKYSEANIVSSNYELEFLESIKNYYAKRSKQVFYFPHRDESEEKLKFIVDNLGFEVKKTHEIAEIHLLKSSVLPAEVAGAYTSTLNSVSSIFPELTLTSFRLDEHEVNVDYQESISNVYQYYKDIGINIVCFN